MELPFVEGSARKLPARFVGFMLISLLVSLAFYSSLMTLVEISFKSEYYSHIVFVPVLSTYLIYVRRGEIFSKVGCSPWFALLLFLFGFSVAAVATESYSKLPLNDYFSLVVLSLLAFWIGGFVLFYGIEAFKVGIFPLLFLALMIPLPSFLLEKVIAILQQASAATAYGLFKITGIPVFREGLRFSLPGFNIEVAKECSGIRSSFALVITGLLAGHLFLEKPWRKVVLVLSVLPIAVFKNALRIVTLSLLSVYVDKRILSSSLHRDGGILFFILALALLAALLHILRKKEKIRGSRDAPSSGEPVDAWSNV